MSDLNIRALGPLEVKLNGMRVSPGGPKQRALLALLIINLNSAVSIEAILDALWGNDPPDSAVGQVQTAVWRLRRVLSGNQNGSGRPREAQLATRPGGYLLALDPGCLDLTLFHETISRGQEYLRAARYGDAAEALHRALTLWRGRPFDDIPVPLVRAEAARLEEQRLTAIEDRIESDLALGRHRQLVPEIRGLVRDHPLRERLRAHLMVALHRSGRQAEALDTYRDGHRLITTEFGLEPGRHLQEVHRAVLADQPAVEDQMHAAGRDELPADIVDFTGRPALVATACAVLSGEAPATGTRPPGVSSRVVGISGPPGVGKTALAVRVAHLLRSHFPDGRLYVDLHGLADQPMPPGEVLNRLLRWCAGTDVTPPEDIEERAALFRSRVAERRVLLVLDNVRSEEQVRHLLPGAPGCAVLLTSRRHLAALDNLTPLDLTGLHPDEAVALIGNIVGADRVAADPTAAGDIAALCGGLPLAVRIAGVRLSTRPHWSLRRLASQLADEHRRLDTLSIGDRGVRSSIALSYTALDDQRRRLFRLLGALTETDVPAWVAAAVVDLPEPAAEALLEDLVDARLAEVRGSGGQDRYGMHTLVRLYAREQCALEDSDDECLAAAERMVGGWLYLTEQAESRLPGGLPRIGSGSARRHPVSPAAAADLDRAMDWFEAERLALVSAIDTACALGLDEMAWDLVGCFGRFLEVRGDMDLWLGVLRRAIPAVEAAGNRRGEAHLLRALAEVWLHRDQYADAHTCLERALRLFDELGEARAQAHVQRAIGVLERMGGDSAAAATRFEHALLVFEKAADMVGLADTLFSLGALHRDQGRADEALTCYRRALRIEEQLGNQLNQALLLCSIGSVLTSEQCLDDARATLNRSLAVAREIQQESCEAYALSFLGEADVLAGELDVAATHLHEALALFQRVADRYGAAITWRNLGDLHRTAGDLDRAGAAIERSLNLWDQLDAPLWRGRTLLTLGRIHLAAGDLIAARSAWRAAETLFESCSTSEQRQARRMLGDLPTE